MPKFARLVTLGVMLMVLACGAMTIRIDTEVADETEIKHEIQMEASGQIAVMMAEEFDQGEIDEIDGDCSLDIDEANEEFSLSCKDLSQEGLSEGQVEGEGFDLKVIKTDMGDYWEYRATMPNPFFGTEEELEDTPLFSGDDLDAIIKLRFHWTVEMPGEVVESNANTYEKATASFTTKLDDDRETLVVVSQQDKGGGGCN